MAINISINSYINKYKQSIARRTIITNISNLVPEPSIGYIPNGDKYNVIRDIGTELSTTSDPSKKLTLLNRLEQELKDIKSMHESLCDILIQILCPKLSSIIKDYAQDSFYINMIGKLNEYKDLFISTEHITNEDEIEVNASNIAVRFIPTIETMLYNITNILMTLDNVYDIDNLSFDEITVDNTLLPVFVVGILQDLKEAKYVVSNIQSLINEDLSTLTLSDLTAFVQSYITTASNEQMLKDIVEIMTNLEVDITTKVNNITESNTLKYKPIVAERQLLEEILNIDTNRDFYYNVSVEPSVAIEFNASSEKLNTLSSAVMNYDVNNVNNNFVISKLDIDYITNGIQIARSSKLN
jgi:hypothetical protein